MSRKSLWMLLWVVVAGFGMSWVGIQKMVLKREAYKGEDQLKETRRLHEELQIEKILLESVLVREMRQAELRDALVLVGNSFSEQGVPTLGNSEEQ